MPIFTLWCECGHTGEYLMAPSDVDTPCEVCGGHIVKATHRDWQADMPAIQGDTVAGGCNYAGYWDDGLSAYVTSKKHRSELMKAKGLSEYSPDPITKTMLDEMRHIRRNSDVKTDPSAVAALREQGKIADKKRKKQSIKGAVDRGIADLKKSMQGA